VPSLKHNTFVAGLPFRFDLGQLLTGIRG